jgi:hypothetical protein
MSPRVRTAIALTAAAGAVLAAGVVADHATATTDKPATHKPAAVSTQALERYPVPCKGCRYIADHREEVEHTVTTPGESRNGGAGGWQSAQQWEMLNGFAEFTISKAGRTHVNSLSWSGQDEYGAHAFNRVWAYVRKATAPGGAPVRPQIVGGKPEDPTRVTRIVEFPRFSPDGATKFTRKVGAPNFVGERLGGLEVVIVADNRGTPLFTVVDPRDVPPGFATRHAS